MSTSSRVVQRDLSQQQEIERQRRERREHRRQQREEQRQVRQAWQDRQAREALSRLSRQQEEELARIAMGWKDLAAVATAASQLGYRQVAPAPLLDAGEPQPVELLFQQPGKPPVGIVRQPQGGVQVVSHDPAVEGQFVNRVAQLYGLQKAQAHLQARGFALRIDHLPSGEIRLEGTRHEGTGEPTRLQVQLEPGGEARVEVKGVKGPDCHPLARSLTAAMDGQVVESRNTPEFFQVPVRTEVKGHVGH